MLHSRECGHDGRGGWNRAQQRHVAAVAHPPVQRVREIEARPAKAYIGKFSQRGDLFVAAYQDRRLRVFDTTGEDFKLRKDVEVRRFRWTVTDCAISRDSGFLLYSSISPQAHLVRIGAGGADDVVHSVSNITEVHEEIDFLADVSSIRTSIGVWSLAWSPSDSIVAAGTSQPGIILYDLAAERRLVAASCHHDDVNAVAFADASGNLLVSGSDDSRLFLHDRRTMRGELARPEGQLLGHTEGVTHVDARGDGRFVISNAKDSTVRLWDLRHMTPGSKVIPEHDLCSLSHFDYRWHEYPHAGMVASRPMDNSIMTFRGHKVLQTLIRAYWAPAATTGGRCIYTGSADGSVYVYDTVTGHVQHELRHHTDVVRDCSWHPHRQQLVSVSWDGSIVEWGPRRGRTFSPSMLVHDYW